MIQYEHVSETSVSIGVQPYNNKTVVQECQTYLPVQKARFGTRFSAHKVASK